MNRNERDIGGGARPELHDIAAAFALLTRLPVPVDHGRAAARGARAAWAWPLAGAAVGALAGLAAAGLLALGLAPGLAAAGALTVSVLATGALHEDGLADSADGLAGGRDRAHALTIMKDSRIGAFGAVALMLGILARWSAIAALPPDMLIAGLAVAGAVSRAAMAWPMALMRAARDSGLSAESGRPGGLTVAIGSGLALGAMMLEPQLRDIATVIAVLSGAVLLTLPLLALAQRRLGGQTGDILGATCVLAEIGVLAALTVQLG